MKRLFLLLVFVLGLVAAVPVCADYGGVTLSAWTGTPPTIDGDPSTFVGEWDDADSA